MRRSVTNSLLTLLLLLVTGHAWAADGEDDNAATSGSEAEDSNMQSWQETWQDERRARGWTWFGMGYESRRAFSDSTGGAHNGGPGKGAGGGGNGRGNGKRR